MSMIKVYSLEFEDVTGNEFSELARKLSNDLEEGCSVIFKRLPMTFILRDSKGHQKNFYQIG